MLRAPIGCTRCRPCARRTPLNSTHPSARHNPGTCAHPQPFRRYDLVAGVEWEQGGDGGLRRNRVVFIGRNLDEKVLRTALLECTAPVAEECEESA
eukprot:2777105-Prymnesium_polylepis.1